MMKDWGRIGLAAGLAAFLAAGCATAPKGPTVSPMAPPPAAPQEPKVSVAAPAPPPRPVAAQAVPLFGRAGDSSGVEIIGFGPTAAGRLMDFRFRVVDPEKASEVLDRRNIAYMVDEKTGARMQVPATKVGSMRQTTMKPERGRIYFIFFDILGRQVGPEDRFTVVVGRHRFENLTVQQGRGDHHETRVR